MATRFLAVAGLWSTLAVGQAPLTQHWAFVPPRRPELPTVRQGSWPLTAIDSFVLAGLEQRGLVPSPPAGRASWLRRVTLDLTGLPPTITDLQAFLADQSSTAHERCVEALLASPAHAEEEARWWLDLARYADTHGMQRDQERALWRWRDWVIEACAANLPYDQFVGRQLAADLEPGASDADKVATGFLRNNPTSDEGGLIPEEFLARYAMDRTDHFGTVFLGLTVGCAQCHDHKSDPLSQREYYRLLAYFASFAEDGNDGGALAPAPAVLAPRPPESARLQELTRACDEARRNLAATATPSTSAVPAVQSSPWRVAGVAANAPPPAATPPAPTSDAPSVAHAPQGSPVPPDLPFVERPELVDAVVHPLGEQVGFTWLRRTLQVPTARTLQLALGSDDGLRLWIDGELRLDRRVQRGAARGQEQIDVDLAAGDHDFVLQIENTGGPSGFAFEIARDEGCLETGPRRAARLALAAAEAALAEYRRTLPRCMVAGELPAPRPVHVLWRGRYDKPGERVAPGTPACLPPLPEDAPADRRALAQWLFRSEQPLTARVVVNRLWQRHFGRGLVATPHDFGAHGARPSHPELLDWLAHRFQQDWDVRALHRLLVLSATYRQSAAATPEQLAADPDNVWLGRMSRGRLPAEAIRDQALLVAGLLERTVGGPSIRPWQPAGIWEATAFPGSNTEHYQQDLGPAAHRRSLYVFWKRTAPPAFLATFDAPTREWCTVDRPSTNTPLQALALANDLGLFEAARAFAERLLAAEGDDAARVALAFRSLLQREPTSAEHAVVGQCLATFRRHFAAAPEAAAAFAVGPEPRAGSMAHERATWTAFTNLLFQLDEALHRG